mmetsp:Transcript_92400/g.263977  ORF Transcript_92400/g.263977 Transcript_92400/m.263977 type:complete len:216 (+) Transcript_92400:438-1085(+)
MHLAALVAQDCGRALQPLGKAHLHELGAHRRALARGGRRHEVAFEQLLEVVHVAHDAQRAARLADDRLDDLHLGRQPDHAHANAGTLELGDRREDVARVRGREAAVADEHLAVAVLGNVLEQRERHLQRILQRRVAARREVLAQRLHVSARAAAQVGQLLSHAVARHDQPDVRDRVLREERVDELGQQRACRRCARRPEHRVALRHGAAAVHDHV